MTKSVLGRGFEGLIPVGFDISHVAEPGEQIKQISLDKLVANPDQPRREFDQQSLLELADSIKEHGIIQPLVVTPHGDRYRIVAGERRFRAAKIAKLDKLPAIIRNHKELEELEISIVENVQRVDLSPLEQAVSILRLRDQFSLTPKEISKKLGKAETTVSNILRLLQLPKEAVDALRNSKISEGHARTILSLKFNSMLQTELLNKILSEGLSVRECEEWVKQQKINNEQKSSSISNMSRNKIKRVHNQGYNLKLQEKKHGGTLIFEFESDEELNRILENF
jgi:ParB family chromosome partitioning protein